MSQLKAQLKRQKVEAKDELKSELKIKDDEKTQLRQDVKLYERYRKADEAENKKLQLALSKEASSLSTSREIYAASVRNVDTLTEVIKDLKSELKKKNRRLQDDQSAKYLHNEKMLTLQVQQEKSAHDREKEKHNNKEESEQTSLKAKYAQTRLAHSLRKQSKDDDVLRKEAMKKRKDVEVNQNVSTIAA